MPRSSPVAVRSKRQSLPVPAAPQGFPVWPTGGLVPPPQGGAVDAVGSMLARHLPADFRQTIRFDNRAGSSDPLGSECVARAGGVRRHLAAGAAAPCVARPVPATASRRVSFPSLPSLRKGVVRCSIRPDR